MLRKVSVAVLPLAGKATRMQPWSCGIPKAVAPILQRQSCGALRLVSGLELILRDILHSSTGFDAVCLVVSPWQRRFIEDWLEAVQLAPRPVGPQALNDRTSHHGDDDAISDAITMISDSSSDGSSKPPLRYGQGSHNESQQRKPSQLADRMPRTGRSLADAVHIVEQRVPAGFGDAILCAQPKVEDLWARFRGDSASDSGSDSADFAVVLGDYAFTAAGASDGGRQCFAALQDAYHHLPPGCGLTAAGTCSREEVTAMGLLQLTDVTAQAEDKVLQKPHTQAEARHHGDNPDGLADSLIRGSDSELPRVLRMLEKPSAAADELVLAPFRRLGRTDPSLRTAMPSSINTSKPVSQATRQVDRLATPAPAGLHARSAPRLTSNPGRYVCNFGIDIMPGRATFELLRRLKAQQHVDASATGQSRKGATTATTAGAASGTCELGLREVQAALAAQGRLHALHMDGFQHHDLGNPAAYWATLQHFASCPPSCTKALL